MVGNSSLHMKITINTAIIKDMKNETPAITTLVSDLWLPANVRFDMFKASPANSKSFISKELTLNPKLAKYRKPIGKKLPISVNTNHIHLYSFRSILSKMFITAQAIYIPYSILATLLPSNFKELWLQPRYKPINIFSGAQTEPQCQPL